MTKEELINRISDDTGYMKVAIENVIDSMISEISLALQRGERTQLTNFGTFDIKKKASKIGRDFSTGKSIQIPAKVVPVFKPGKALCESVAIKIEGGK